SSPDQAPHAIGDCARPQAESGRKRVVLLPRPSGDLSAKLTEGVFFAAKAPSERFAPTSPAVAGED
ncbi:MAG: hypothetical protein RL186_1797, partial [Pseudomonadota bacterium]